MRAFPMVINEMNGDAYFSAEQQFSACYGLRTINRFAQFWGLIDMRELPSSNQYPFEYELQAPQLSEWLRFYA